MKFKHSVIFGIVIVATLTTSCTKEVTINQTQTQAPTPASVAESGNFKAREYPAQGTAKVITEQGKRYLVFDQKFKTGKGPDLFVILHRSDAPPLTGIKEKDYVNIAPLQKTSGTQRYALPGNLKLAEYKSVAIWCRKFNSTFAYASL
ncbi:DM13 domain-containing protein [Nostoc sp. CENA67]|uniref:DM13 domain-containing protein n=1 Tax=Amazonocrinis nigriterrae CENA67 TaxID=2794033 RepID=A0A8J7L9P9_9NOST|nr:DM13 domain-containing protein [Amazonocrinis nigriterrae]MBH8561726.1 DM13 domain-containing protein [Amazonocrinis nigriterrae CENA67]